MNEFVNNHNLVMENRNSLKLTGITDVDTFNDTEIKCLSHCGMMLIKGEGLHIEVLDLTQEKLEISGKICAVVYSNAHVQKSKFKSLFS